MYGEEENHYSLDLRPDTLDRFCVFSLRFSSDDKELITAYVGTYPHNHQTKTQKEESVILCVVFSTGAVMITSTSTIVKSAIVRWEEQADAVDPWK